MVGIISSVLNKTTGKKNTEELGAHPEVIN